jgi:hypothetical protein
MPHFEISFPQEYIFPLANLIKASNNLLVSAWTIVWLEVSWRKVSFGRRDFGSV